MHEIHPVDELLSGLAAWLVLVVLLVEMVS